MRRRCRLLDGGDRDALVSLFTEDGEFVGLSRACGHAELRAFFAGLAEGWDHGRFGVASAAATYPGRGS